MPREKKHLRSTAGTGHFYTTRINTKLSTGKLELMKYDPIAKKHVKYVEAKGSASSSGKKKT